MESLKNNDQIDLSYGEQDLNMTYIDDVIEGYLTSFEILKNEENFGHVKYDLFQEKNIKLKEIINIYRKISKKEIKVNWGKLSYYENQVMKPVKGKKLPHWNQKISIEEGLKKIHKNKII